jgi:hypothetical protein
MRVWCLLDNIYRGANMKLDFRFMKAAATSFLIIWGSLVAEEEGDNRVQVGTRALSHAEVVQIQEERSEQADKATEGKDAQETLLSKEAFQSSVKYTSHPGAFYNPIYVSPLGDKVELHDGSIWSVASYDAGKTFNWLTTDLVVITPNHEWFSSYMFKMTNQNTAASIKCNLTLGPIYNGLYTHWITAINYYTHEICLEDGSIWKVTGFDASIFSKWLLNDTIIIGVNDGFLSSSKPNMLINVNTLTYVRADCTWQ